MLLCNLLLGQEGEYYSLLLMGLSLMGTGLMVSDTASIYVHDESS